jgi:RNA polymerase sigma-70 factor, ECF subfamily
VKHERSLPFTDQAELVSRAQHADHGAFAELMQRTTGASLRIANTMLKSHHLAEEEVQNAYLKAWQHLDQFQGGSLFSTWMSRIVVNQCLMHLRSLRRFKMISMEGVRDSEGKVRPLDLADRTASAEARVCGESQAVDLSREIGRLPTKLRRALILRDVNELSTQEAATSLGISGAALKSRLLRARGELRRRLTPGRHRQSQTVSG